MLVTLQHLSRNVAQTWTTSSASHKIMHERNPWWSVVNVKLSRLIHSLFRRHSVSEFAVIGSCRCRTLFHRCAWGLNYSFCLYLSVIEVRVVKWAFGLETRFRELSLSRRSVEMKVCPALKRCLLQLDNTCFQFWDVFIVRSRNAVDFSLCSVQKLDWLALTFAKRFFLDVCFLWWSSASSDYFPLYSNTVLYAWGLDGYEVFSRLNIRDWPKMPKLWAACI